MKTRRLAAVAVLAAVTAAASVAGCARTVATDTGQGLAAPAPEGTGDPDAALAAWADFPADRHPRPIVPIGPAVQYAGYTTDAAKVAAMSGAYRQDVRLPPDPPPAAVALPDGPATLPVIGAAAALDRLRSGGGAGRSEPSPAPLAITGIEFGSAGFGTDRGALTLPVWRVHTADEIGPTVVLAVAESALYRRPGTNGAIAGVAIPGSGTARLGEGGRRLTLIMTEGEPFCPGQPIYTRTAGVRESASAVVVTFTATRTGTVPGEPGACPAMAKLQQVTYTVDLAAPLGARVLIGADAAPLPVTTG